MLSLPWRSAEAMPRMPRASSSTTVVVSSATAITLALERVIELRRSRAASTCTSSYTSRPASRPESSLSHRISSRAAMVPAQVARSALETAGSRRGGWELESIGGEWGVGDRAGAVTPGHRLRDRTPGQEWSGCGKGTEVSPGMAARAGARRGENLELRRKREEKRGAIKKARRLGRRALRSGQTPIYFFFFLAAAFFAGAFFLATAFFFAAFFAAGMGTSQLQIMAGATCAHRGQSRGHDP